jgi:excisionase family DNA binding protein
MSVTEASSMAKVSDETIRAWYDTGEITGIRDGRGHRLIDRGSLDRRLDSVGVVEASRIVDRSPYMVRQWFDLGLVEGYVTATGRRRISRSSMDEYMRELAARTRKSQG